MIIASIVWIMVTVGVVASALALAKRLDPTSGSFAVVHTIVIAWTWIVAVAATLSVCHWLTGPFLVVGVSGVALAMAIGNVIWRRQLPADSPNDVEESRNRWPAILWGFLLCFWAGHVASGGLLRFTTDWDSLMYHIPLIDYWLQARSLHAPASGQWSNPGSNELIGLWAVAPFPNDSLVMLGNIPATLLLAFGTLELGRLLKLVPIVRHATAFAVVSNFVVMKQLVDAENDVAVAGLFITCLCYGLREVSRNRSAASVLGPVTLGLLCGVKYYALGLAAVAWAFAMLLAWSSRGILTGVRVALVWATGAGLVGGFWYVRNAIVSGSPFFPLVMGSGATTLTVDYPTPWQTTFLGNGRPEVWPLALEAVWKMTGPCQFAAIYAFPSVFVWLSLGWIRTIRKGQCGSLERPAVALAMAGSVAVLWITPMALEDVPGSLNQLRWSYTPVRYGLGALSLATIGLALALQDGCRWAHGRRPGGVERSRGPWSGGWLAPALGVTIGCSSLFQFVGLEKGVDVDWLISLWIAANLGFAALATPRLMRQVGGRVQWLIAVALACVVTGTATWGIHWLSQTWDAQFVAFYESNYHTSAIGKLDSLTPRPTRVAYYDYRCYPFFGPRRKVRICQERPVPSFNEFQTYLAWWEVSHIVVRSDNSVEKWDNYRSVEPWLKEHPDKFEKVYSDATHAIYRVIRPAAN